MHDCLNTLGIKLIKDIIEQEKRRGIGAGPLQETKLSQLQGNDKTLVLSLASLTLHLIIAYRKLQVITMYTMKRIAHSPILESIALNHLQQRSSLAMGDVMQTHLLLIARNMLVNLLKQRHQFVDESLAAHEELFPVNRHLLLPKLHQRSIRLRLHLQQSIALLQRLVVIGEIFYVSMVILRDDHIHQFSPFLASPLDERNIRRRYEDERNQSDVLRQSLVLLLVALEMLLGASLHTAVDVFRIPIIILVITLKHEESLIVSDDL